MVTQVPPQHGDGLHVALCDVLARRTRLRRVCTAAGAALFGVGGFVLGGALGPALRTGVEPHVLATLMVSCPCAGVVLGGSLGARLVDGYLRHAWEAWCCRAAQQHGCDHQQLAARLQYVMNAPPA
jgi:hypothetical protein